MAINPTLSVIVVNWNTRDLLRQCLDSVFNETRRTNFEVIVVDNASTDGSAQMVKEHFPKARLWENPANLGFAKAVNQGLQLAQGEILTLLNSDAYIVEGALDKVVGFMGEYPEVAVVGCKVLNTDRSWQRSAFLFPTMLDILFESLFLVRLFPRSGLFNRRGLGSFDGKSPKEVDWVAGACLTIRREIVEEVGMMDEDFFMYAEESDWCHRIKKHGYKILFYPHAEIVHLGRGSINQALADLLPRAFKGRFRYFEKHRGLWYARAVKLITILGMLLRIAILFLPSLLRPSLRSRLIAYAKVIRQTMVEF